MKIRVMTFNIQSCTNYLESRRDYDIIANTIKKLHPDIVGLNEVMGKGTSTEMEEQTEILAKLTKMKYFKFARAIDFPNGGEYGNGFLSSLPIKKAQIIEIPDPVEKNGTEWYETRCLLKVELENGLTVLVCHFGLNNDELINAVNTAVRHIKNEKCVFMGDFNMLPDNKMLLPIREQMNDSACLFEKPLLSWPSDKPEMKIDYIFVSHDIKVISADIPAIISSDHRPYIADIEF